MRPAYVNPPYPWSRESVRGEVHALQRTMIQAGAALLAALVGVIVAILGVIATQPQQTAPAPRWRSRNSTWSAAMRSRFSPRNGSK
jgi:hypothetical protein